VVILSPSGGCCVVLPALVPVGGGHVVFVSSFI
jgi:hypothetical protein